MHSPLEATGRARPGPARLSPRAASTTVALVAGLMAAGSLASPTLSWAEVKPAGGVVNTAFGQAPLTFADIVEKVKPSVVSISVTTGGNAQVASRGKDKKGDRAERGERRMPEGLPEGLEDNPLFEYFFKNMPKEFRQQQERPQMGQGSGFVISSDGYVVTNNHVIDGANKIQVQFDDKEKYEAELIGTDPRTDVALIKIKSDKAFPAVKFADKPVRVGDWALAVGNPFGLGGTVTAGIVSALSRDINNGPYDFIQIDAAVNKGNSGGPTFNLDGEVIGMNTAIFSPSGGNVGIAFAVPAHTALQVVDQLKKSGSVSRGWLGVKIQNVDEDTAAALGLADAKGALVSEVTGGGPAAAAGLKAQDAILSVNGDKIADSKDLARKIADYAPDTTVDVKVWRGSGEQSVKVKLGKFPGTSEEIAKLEQGEGSADTPDEETGETSLDKLGIKVAPAKAEGPGKSADGVEITEVEPDSDAAEKGLKSGDVILEVDRQTVSSPEDVVAALKKVEGKGLKAVMLHVKASDQKRIVSLKLGNQG